MKKILFFIQNVFHLKLYMFFIYGFIRYHNFLKKVSYLRVF